MLCLSLADEILLETTEHGSEVRSFDPEETRQFILAQSSNPCFELKRKCVTQLANMLKLTNLGDSEHIGYKVHIYRVGQMFYRI